MSTLTSSPILSFAHGEVRLGGKLLPGILRRQQVRGAVRFDESQQDGMSGKVKVPLGWEDEDVTLVLDLLTEEDSTCYDKLAELVAVFKDTDGTGNPRVFSVANPHLAARNIDQVVFSRLDSKEDDDDDILEATLGFVEHAPPITRVEKRIQPDGLAAYGELDPWAREALGNPTAGEDEPGFMRTTLAMLRGDTPEGA